MSPDLKTKGADADSIVPKHLPPNFSLLLSLRLLLAHVRMNEPDIYEKLSKTIDSSLERNLQKTNKKLSVALSSTTKDEGHIKLVTWVSGELQESIYPQINESKLKESLTKLEDILSNEKVHTGNYDIFKYVTFSLIYEVYNTNIIEGNYPKIKSWFKEMRLNKIIAHVGLAPRGACGQHISPKMTYNPKNTINLSRLGLKHSVPIPGQRNILITSALPYVNNSPHIGNLVGCVLSADAYARYCRVREYNIMFICGTDEYGTTTEFRALQEGVSCEYLCDKYFKIHSSVYEWMDIDFDFFGRTSTKNHTDLTQEFYVGLNKNNFIIENEIEQLYCNNHAKFLADRFVEGTCPICKYAEARGDQCDHCGFVFDSASMLVDPICKVDGTVPVIKSTKHLFLNLTKISDKLEKWIDSTCDVGFWSQNTVNISKSWFVKGLKPRCITRDLSWGVPVEKEGYESKVFYVWFDACIGYPSITADYIGDDWVKWWKNPKDVKLYQFMGKDNTSFHTVVFPAMQIGTDENWTMLHHIDTTEFLLFEDEKFSKSRGVGVFGDDLIKLGIPPSVWRFHLLLNRPEKSDTRFTWDSFAHTLNYELVASIGNLISRVVKFVERKYNSFVPEYSISGPNEQKFISNVNEILTKYLESFEALRVRSAVRCTLELSSIMNKYLQDNHLDGKHLTSNPEECNNIIGASLNGLYLLAALLYPFIPGTSADIYKQLNLPTRRIEDEWTCSDILPGHRIGIPFHLFKVITPKEIEKLKIKFSSKKEVITSKPD